MSLVVVIRYESFARLDDQPVGANAGARDAVEAVSGWRGGGSPAGPRGPQVATRAHPLGLTKRQAEVLRRLAHGYTNSEIAQQLFLSVRTVDHHVSAILMKLGMSNRREAARLFRASDAATA